MTAERCRRVVLTGGPGSGKTSLVEHYQKAGHAIVPEAALQIIQELTRTMGLAAQRRWRQKHVIEFQRLVPVMPIAQRAGWIDHAIQPARKS